jgi:hypothetical protein
MPSSLATLQCLLDFWNDGHDFIGQGVEVRLNNLPTRPMKQSKPLPGERNLVGNEVPIEVMYPDVLILNVPGDMVDTLAWEEAEVDTEDGFSMSVKLNFHLFHAIPIDTPQPAKREGLSYRTAPTIFDIERYSHEAVRDKGRNQDTFDTVC